MKLNFVLHPPADVQTRAIEISRALVEQYEAYFVLGESENLPHITVYPAEYPDELSETVMRQAAEIINASELPRLVFSRLETHQGYIGVEFERTPELIAWHRLALDTLSPLRIQQKPTGSEYQMDFTPEQIASLERYGFADALDLWRPHLTLGRLKDEPQAREATAQITWPVAECMAHSAGLCEVGAHGVCVSRLLMGA